MMDKIIAILIGIALLIIGRVRVSYKIKGVHEKIKSSDEFLARVKDYLNSLIKDQKTYSWLVQMSHQFQLEMGFYGVIPFFYHQLSRTSIPNYQIIINGIPELRRMFDNQDYPSDKSALRDFGLSLTESILRHRGELLSDLNVIEKGLKNPIIWLTQGISWVLLLFPSFLEQIGLLSEAKLSRFKKRPLLKFVSGIVSLMELTGTIMTIIMGWDAFVEIIIKAVVR
jgi:hypothetical protein